MSSLQEYYQNQILNEGIFDKFKKSPEEKAEKEIEKRAKRNLKKATKEDDLAGIQNAYVDAEADIKAEKEKKDTAAEAKEYLRAMHDIRKSDRKVQNLINKNDANEKKQQLRNAKARLKIGKATQDDIKSLAEAGGSGACKEATEVDQEFYQNLFEFCAANDIELNETAVAELRESGIFDEIEESRREFLESVYDFCVEHGVEVNDEVIEQMQEAGVFDSEDDNMEEKSPYDGMMEFFVMNGVKLNAEQIQTLKNQ